MRFNLKNRPRLFIQAENYADYYFKTEKWFEVFEKELRELREKPYLSLESRSIITEILGEE